jgi:hypothetical protein
METEQNNKLGLGDVLEKVIEVIVPKVVIEKVKAKGCNCEEKKIWLNNFGAQFG